MRARLTKLLLGVTALVALAVGGSSLASAASKSSPAPVQTATIDTAQPAPASSTATEAADTDELMTIKPRYKEPEGQTSRQLEFYFSGNVEIRSETKEGSRLFKAEEVYLDAHRNVALALKTIPSYGWPLVEVAAPLGPVARSGSHDDVVPRPFLSVR